MNLYKVILRQGEPEFVEADDWQHMGEQYVFYRRGKAISFFEVTAAISIKLEKENYDPDALNKYLRENQDEETYPDPLEDF